MKNKLKTTTGFLTYLGYDHITTQEFFICTVKRKLPIGLVEGIIANEGVHSHTECKIVMRTKVYDIVNKKYINGRVVRTTLVRDFPVKDKQLSFAL